MEKGGLKRANVVYDFPTAFDLLILTFVGKFVIVLIDVHDLYIMGWENA